MTPFGKISPIAARRDDTAQAVADQQLARQHAMELLQATLSRFDALACYSGMNVTYSSTILETQRAVDRILAQLECEVRRHEPNT